MLYFTLIPTEKSQHGIKKRADFCWAHTKETDDQQNIARNLGEKEDRHTDTNESFKQNLYQNKANNSKIASTKPKYESTI